MNSDYNPRVFGYVNGEPTYSRDEFVFKCRHRGPIDNDDDLIAFAEKVTHGWYSAGWKHKFEDFYISDYCLDEPLKSMTVNEFNRLKELQRKAQERFEAAEEDRKWKHIKTIGYADNSVEEIWEDKDGNRKTVMTMGPHGDFC